MLVPCNLIQKCYIKVLKISYLNKNDIEQMTIFKDLKYQISLRSIKLNGFGQYFLNRYFSHDVIDLPSLLFIYLTRMTTTISTKAQRNQTSIFIRGRENRVSP